VLDPLAYKDKPIYLRGQVFFIQKTGDTYALQMWSSYPGAGIFDREAVVVIYEGDLTGVYEDTYIDVYGIGAGTFTGTNAYGGTIVQPRIVAAHILVP
jgi:hypothetical protein